MSGEGWLRRGAGLPRPTFLELFFDLAFVFALTRLSESLSSDLSWHGAYRTLVLLAALWWTWTTATWVTDLYESSHPGLQVLVVVVMFGVIVMATSVAGAFDGQSVVFAAAYVGAHLCRSTVLALALRHEPLHRRPLRIGIWALGTAPLWLTGAMLHGVPQRVLWTLGILLDYTGAVTGWPVPGLGRSEDSEWHLGAEHVAERYRQMFIIVGGPVLFLVGRILFGRLVLGHPSRSRIIALAGLAVVGAVAPLLPPVVVAALTAGVLATILVPVVSTRVARLIHEPVADRQA